MNKQRNFVMIKLKNAVGYIRINSNELSDVEFGIEEQKQAILKYANDNGFGIVEWKIDTANDANDACPELNEILYGDVLNPPFEAVIIFENDVFAHDIKLFFYYFYVLDKKNIKLLCTQQNFAEGDKVANACHDLICYVAEQERRNIALRTGRARSIKASCGGYSGGRCPYGYKVENGRLIINDEEAIMVKKVFELLSNRYTLQDTADWLNDNDFRTRKGKKFYPSNIKAIKDNKPLYQGMYKYGKMKSWVKGVHEPILNNTDENL